MEPTREASRIGANRKPIRGWPFELATGFGHGRRRLVARDDFIDPEQVVRIVLAFRLSLADEDGRHQLMIALAVIDLVRLQRDVGGQLQIFQRACQFDSLERLLLVCGEREASCTDDIAEPVTRGRLLADCLADIGDEVVHAGGTSGCFHHHSNIQSRCGPPAASQRATLELVQRARTCISLSMPNCTNCFMQLICRSPPSSAARPACSARLDQIGGEVGGADRRQLVAGHGAAQLLQVVANSRPTACGR